MKPTKVNLGNVRVSREILADLLFGREFSGRISISNISADAAGDLVLQVTGQEADVPEGDCSAILETFETLGGGSAVRFKELKKCD